MNPERRRLEHKRIQELLRELRVEAGLRQIDVARKLGVPQSRVSKYEWGERRLDLLEVRDLCKLFGVSLSDFVASLELKLRGRK